MTMLFRLAEWHAFVKLRMHTESTLTRMESVTTVLGRELCKFSNVTCSAFSTVELPRETAARGRRRARTQAKAAKPDGPDGSIAPALSSGMRSKKRCKKKLNLSTYKLHSLGDYVRTIRMFGTTDSFSTQPVSTVLYTKSHRAQVLLPYKGEREHRRPKRLYGRTNKNLAIKQMTKHERRETRLLRAWRATCAAVPTLPDLTHTMLISRRAIHCHTQTPLRIIIFQIRGNAAKIYFHSRKSFQTIRRQR